MQPSTRHSVTKKYSLRQANVTNKHRQISGENHQTRQLDSHDNDLISEVTKQLLQVTLLL